MSYVLCHVGSVAPDYPALPFPSLAFRTLVGCPAALLSADRPSMTIRAALEEFEFEFEFELFLAPARFVCPVIELSMPQEPTLICCPSQSAEKAPSSKDQGCLREAALAVGPAASAHGCMSH